MRLAFAGTPEFAVQALDALHQAGHEIAAVYTQPDRPAGRGRKLRASPVAERAAALGLELRKPERFDASATAALDSLNCDMMVVVAYGLILPQTVLDTPRRGCLNIHASLLPRWRGAAPIQRAILAGDGQTGVTIMQMDAGLDTGPMLLREAVPISARTTAASLHDELAALGARLIVRACADAGALQPTAQPDSGACYAAKISKQEARLDWQLPAAELARNIRAYNPVPVAWSELEGERIRLFDALPEPGSGAEPGRIRVDHDGRLLIACGDGWLEVFELQRPGARRAPAAQALQNWRPDGQRFS